MLQPLREATTAHYAPMAAPSAEGAGRVPSGGLKVPTWVNKAFSGMRIFQIAEFLEDDLPLYKPTQVIIAAGTVEVDTTRQQTQDGIAACIGFLQAAGSPPTLWIGPYAYGEKWPSGANTGTGASNDQRLDEANTDLTNLFVPNYPNGLYVDLRTTMYVVDMPPLNPGNNYIGPFTEDGVHITPSGRAWMWQRYIQPAVRFT